jgi:hypothetical protein
MSMLSFNECNERSTFVKGFFRQGATQQPSCVENPSEITSTLS